MSQAPGTTAILTSRGKALALLSILTALAIAAHLFEPEGWPHLGIMILQSLHGPGFAALALIILYYLQRQCRSSVNYLLAAGVAIGIGLLAEVAQIPGPRNAEKADLVTDALGIFGALGLAAAFDRQIQRRVGLWVRLALPLLAGAGLALAVVPTIWLTYALVRQNAAFPVLLEFEQSWESATFHQSGSADHGMQPAPDGWPGGGMVLRGDDYGRRGHYLNMRPLHDWSDYNRFVFVAASEGEPFDLDIDIRDRRTVPKGKYLAYKTSVRIDQVPREYSISFQDITAHTADFDFGAVLNIVFSAGKPDSGHVVLLDQIRLER